MAESQPRKRGRPPGPRKLKQKAVPDMVIPTTFSRSGRPIKMRELPDGTHFGIMNLPVAVKREPVFESPAPPPAKKRKLEKKSEKSPITGNTCPEKEPAEAPVESTLVSTEAEPAQSAGDIYLISTTLESCADEKLRKKKSIPRKPVSDGNGSYVIKTKLKGIDSLEIKIEKNVRNVPSKVIKEEAVKLKSRIENGEPLPPFIQKCIDEVVEQKNKMIKKEREERFAQKDMIQKELEYIFQMAECDLMIKDSLSKRHWEHIKCLDAFRKLWNVPVTRQMLFKFPRAFETAKYVYSHIENAEAFSDPEKPPDPAAIMKHHICEAAKKVYESYKSVFSYSEDDNFWDFFKAELEHYQAEASTTSMYDYYNSNRLPNSTRCFNM